MRKPTQGNVVDIADESIPTAELLVQILDGTRKLQAMIPEGQLQMLYYLLSMVENEAEAHLMDEKDSNSDLIIRESGTGV